MSISENPKFRKYKFVLVSILALMIGVLLGTITGVMVSIKVADARDQNSLISYKQRLLSEVEVNYQIINAKQHLTEPLATDAYDNGVASGNLYKLSPELIAQVKENYLSIREINQLYIWESEYNTIENYYASKSGPDDKTNYYSSRGITFHELSEAFALPSTLKIAQSDVPDNMLTKIAQSDVPDNMLSLLNALKASTNPQP